MSNQDNLEQKLFTSCPVCKSNELIDITISCEEPPFEYLIEHNVTDLAISSEWDGKICRKCNISWSVARWVTKVEAEDNFDLNLKDLEGYSNDW